MKYLITFCLMLLTQVGFTQDPELLNDFWYLQEVTIDGTTYDRPYPDFQARAQFLATFMQVSHPTCEESFSSNIFYTNQDEFSIDDASVILLGNCVDPSILLFVDMHYNLYLLDNAFARNPFTYGITTGSGGKTLTVMNGDGDVGVYGDVLLSSTDFSESKFTIYPNPVDDVLYIENSSIDQIKMIRVYDLLGKVVMEEHDNVVQIDVAGLRSGLFLLKIETDRGTVNRKIIKH